MMKKRICLILLAFAVAFTCTACGFSSKESCDWCGDTPTKGFKMSNDAMSYVCKDCSSECLFCGEKATKHYESALEAVVFVCNDCYQEVMEMNK